MKILWMGLLFSSAVFSFDNPYLMRSPQALLMGDAFTAVNDDEYTLFYNPASLGRHKNDLTLTPFNVSAGGTNIMDDMDKFKDFPEEPVAASDILMDYPAHAHAGIAPGFKLFNVGVTFLANESYDLLLRNHAHPMLDLDLRSDRGVVMGIGIPLGSSRLNRKSLTGSQTSMGISGKYIERTGLRDTLAFTGPRVVDSLGQDGIQKIIESLGRVKGRGYGFDVGFEHVMRAGNTQLALGLAALDLTGTDLKEDKNPDDLKVADIKDQINLGMAFGQDFKLFHYIVSADLRGLSEEMDMGKRFRLGAQIGIPGIKLLAGVNSGYYSYGAMLDVMFMKVLAGFYGIEMGSKYKQTQSKRFIIYLNLFDFSFDA